MIVLIRDMELRFTPALKNSKSLSSLPSNPTTPHKQHTMCTRIEEAIPRALFCGCGIWIFSQSFTSIKASASSIILVNHLHSVLLQAPHLESLLLSPGESTWQLPTSLPTVDLGILAVLPKLRHIDVTGRDTEWVSSVLQAISYGPQRNLFVSSQRADRLAQILSLFTCIMSHAIESSNIRQVNFNIIRSTQQFRLSTWRAQSRHMFRHRFSFSS
jgi:hypothetical protein